MGFKLGRTYVLEFEAGTYLAGAVVRMRSTSIATVEKLEEMNFSEGLPLFLQHVEGWNLEDADGNPLPLDEDAVNAVMEKPVRDRLIQEWYKAAIGVSAPLDPPSPDGRPSLEAEPEVPSIPMETLSIPLVSTSEQHAS